ncbi:hypothetical protein [Syntrophomonas curvata]
MKLMELFTSIQDTDPRNMDIIEKITYYTCAAHAVFEEARNTLNPAAIAQAEHALHEMLEVIDKSRIHIEAPENLAILQEANDLLQADYQLFR